MYIIDFSELAENDLFDILQYITKVLKASASAEKLYEQIIKKIKSVSNNPYSIPFVKDEVLKSKGIRVIHVNNYSVFYILDEINEKMIIIRILYSRRDWKNLFL
jgi:toxin ParE1/3/4